MNSSLIIVCLEAFELAAKVDRIPEERAVEVLAPNRPDQSLDEGMRHRHVRDGLDLFDLEDSQIGEPSVKAKQRIVIRTQPRRRRMARNGLIEHATHDWTVNGLAADAESDDSTGIHVDHHEDPVAAKEDRLAAKQIDAPKTVLGVRKEGQPGRTRGLRVSAVVVLRQDPAYDISIDLGTERMSNLLGDALIAESWIAALHLDDRGDEFLRGTLRAGIGAGSDRGEQAPIFSVDQCPVEP